MVIKNIIATFIMYLQHNVEINHIFSCKSVASRCIELFVRHACILRPLTDFGRAKLIVDFSQVCCNICVVSY